MPWNGVRERYRSVGARLSGRLSAGAVCALLAGAFFVLGCVVGQTYVERRGQGEYYQRDFGPAVMLACGEGFRERMADKELNEFLSRTREEYECPNLTGPQPGGVTAFAASERYLMTAVAVVWKLRGAVRWDLLTPLFAILYGLTSAALFCLFRLFTRTPTAVVGGVLATVSPVYLENLPHLRDFSKAPFILAGLCAIGLLARSRLAPLPLVATAAAVGGIAGLGYGFRADVLILLPLALLVLAAFTPYGLRGAPGWRAVAAVACAALFGITALPVFLSYPDDAAANGTLMAVHGVAEPFTDALGLEQDLYSPSYLYNDSYAVALVNAHAFRIEGERRPLPLLSRGLEQHSRSLYLDIARTFPADAALRVHGATVRALEFGAFSTLRVDVVPAEVDPKSIVSRIRDRVGDSLRWALGVLPLALAALLVGALRNARLALLVLLTVVYLAAVSTVQFSGRHVFYLEPLWWLAAAFLLETVVLLGLAARRDRGRLRNLELRRPLLGVGGVALVLLAIASLPLLLRAYQDGRVERVLSRYESAPRVELATTDRRRGPDRVLVELRDDRAWRGNEFGESALVVATFSREACSAISVAPVARYRASDPFNDWSTPLDVRLGRQGPESVDVYFLGFRQPLGAFVGFELPKEQRPCLKRVQAITDTSGFPLLLYATLPEDWRRVTRHATLAKWEDRRRVFEHGVLVVSNSRNVPPLDRRGQPFSWRPNRYEHRDVELRGDRLEYDERVDGRYTYLVQSAERELAERRWVIVRGRVERGGVTVGLLYEHNWAAQAHVLQEGEFYAAIEAPESRRYSLVVANNVGSEDARNDVLIRSVQWNVRAREDRGATDGEEAD